MRRFLLNDFKLAKERFVNSNNSLFSSKIFENYDYFKDVYIVNSLKEYVSFINILILDYYWIKESKESKNRIQIREKYIFRGFSNFDQLKPTIMRDKNLLNKEFDYIKKFEENGCIKLGQFNNPIDLAAAAQHFGTKTRLLDWSYSPLVATLFSLYGVSEHNDYYGLIIRNNRDIVVVDSLVSEKDNNCESLSYKYANMMNKYDNIKRIKIDTLNNVNIDEVYSKGFNFILDYFYEIVRKTNIIFEEKLIEEKAKLLTRKFLKNESNLFIKTNFSNERLRNQRGLFEIIDIHSDKNEYFKKELSNSILLVIPLNVRKEIIKYINNLGINYYTLIDDPQNCSEMINRTINGSLSFDSNIEYIKSNQLSK